MKLLKVPQLLLISALCCVVVVQVERVNVGCRSCRKTEVTAQGSMLLQLRRDATTRTVELNADLQESTLDQSSLSYSTIHSSSALQQKAASQYLEHISESASAAIAAQGDAHQSRVATVNSLSDVQRACNRYKLK